MKKSIFKFFKNVTVLAVLFLMVATTLIFNLPTIKVKADENIIKSERTISIDDEFEDDCVIVVLDKKIGGINKNHSLNFFKSNNFKEIIDLTKVIGDISKKNYLNKDNYLQVLKIRLKNKSKQNVIKAINLLEKIPGVLRAEPNYISKATVSEANQNDPPAINGTRYEDQWGINGVCGSGANLAWRITRGRQEVKVGIMDTGIYAHDDLQGNISGGYDFILNKEPQGDNIGGHGTHVAGIIGATGASEDGVVGVCQDIKLVPMIVALPVLGSITTEWFVAALTWAINNDIDIINYSAGGTTESEAQKAVLSNYNGLFICAAGNGGADNIGYDTDASAFFPANYSTGQTFSDRVISVGAISENGEVASFSNYGKNTVSLFAPGESILSTYYYAGTDVLYSYESGTSMATPFVTGTAALLFSQYVNNAHGLSRAEIAAQVKQTILANVLKDARYTDKCSSGGRLRTYAALYQMPFRKVMDDFGFKDGSNTFEGKVDLLVGDAKAIDINLNGKLVIEQNTSLTFAVGTITSINFVKIMNGRMTFQLKNSAGEVVKIAGEDTHVSTVRVGLLCNEEYTNPSFTINTASLSDDTYTLNMTSVVSRDGVTQTSSKSYQFIIDRSSCVTEGTMVTLADGQMVAVENLTGNEQLLVWNFLTGTIDTAPILFIDSDSETTYEIIELSFSDGTIVKVVDEHGFWDINLNKFVYIRSDAMQYVGHWFKKQNINANGGTISTQVQLVGVRIYNETTTTWSPVTFGHLCLYVNGMLSMPGATEGLTNIFAVNPETMKYDEVAMVQDIATYGLFTYEELNAIVPMPEVMFNAVNGQYLKVAIGKGLITINQIEMLVERYSMFF